MHRVPSHTLTLFLGLAVLSGCGGEPEHTVVRGDVVSGTVTLDGKPIAKGTITLTSEEDTRNGIAPGVGNIVDGAYTVKTIAGKRTVRISVPEEFGEVDETGERDTRETLPAKFNSESTLEIDVKEGENTKDFALES